MQLHRISLKNFRLLRDVSLYLENDTTVIVGRNNSGKTSLYESLRRFTSDSSAPFYLQDFSTQCYAEFCEAYKAYLADKEGADVRKLLPYIELRLFFKYDPKVPELGPLSEFVVDLDMDCDEALIVLRFELSDGATSRLFEGISQDVSQSEGRRLYFRELADRIKRFYAINIWAEDPNDSGNRKNSTQASVKRLLRTGFINAQRGLDDTTTRENGVIAKVLEGLFSTASLGGPEANDHAIAVRLEDAVKGIQTTIDEDFRTQLKALLPTLKSFGYPGLGGSELTTETTLDVQRLLTNHTSVRYEGHDGVLLPETYNGLGMRNLIYILLRVVSFYRAFRAEPDVPGVQVVFIEEPEAHLHPQMQEVFIRQIGALVNSLNKQEPKKAPWKVQFVVSTHSSHVANEARFECIRYFLPKPINIQQNIWITTVKDLRNGLPPIADAEKDFLHQYLTLTRCDLFFADKAILVEGTSERLLLPVISEKHDAQNTETPLRSQYLTVMEVGGAYAHIFQPLLNFLELQTLIITDLDPVKKVEGDKGARYKKCLVHEAETTSNACIKSWFDDKACDLVSIIAKTEAERTKGQVRIAYQCREKAAGPCGRTFEDAFLLANIGKFKVEGADANELEGNAKDMAEAFKKSDFALTHAIKDKEWDVPKYILDGLVWLSKGLGSPPDGVSLPANDSEKSGQSEVSANAQ